MVAGMIRELSIYFAKSIVRSTTKENNRGKKKKSFFYDDLSFSQNILDIFLFLLPGLDFNQDLAAISRSLLALQIVRKRKKLLRSS